MNNLFLYINKGFVLKAHEVNGAYFVSFSYLDVSRSYPCPDKELAVELAKSLAESHAKNMEMIDKLYGDLNPLLF